MAEIRFKDYIWDMNEPAKFIYMDKENAIKVFMRTSKEIIIVDCTFSDMLTINLQIENYLEALKKWKKKN